MTVESSSPFRYDPRLVEELDHVKIDERPSQKKEDIGARLKRGIEFLSPVFPSMPMDTGKPSVNALVESWQLAQDTVPSADKDLSWNR